MNTELLFKICQNQELYINRYKLRIIKPNGKVKIREIVTPSKEYKELQRELNLYIKDLFPIHPKAYAWLPNKNRFDCALQHYGKKVVVELDIKDFFPSITDEMLYRLFLENNIIDVKSVPLEVIVKFITLPQDASINGSKKRYLPQGFATSPTLANAIRYKLDCFVEDVANTHNLTFTSYGDNIFLSGEYVPHDVIEAVIREAASFGFQIPNNKVKIMPYYKRQQILGFTVNKKVNIPKDYAKRVIDTIFDYLRAGKEPDPHLLGLINALSFSENLRHYRYAKKLLTYFSNNLLITKE